MKIRMYHSIITHLQMLILSTGCLMATLLVWESLPKNENIGKIDYTCQIVKAVSRTEHNVISTQKRLINKKLRPLSASAVTSFCVTQHVSHTIRYTFFFRIEQECS
jgi:hypothetical protein